MRFVPGNPDCSPGTAVFTHLSIGDLEMKVDPDSTSAFLAQEFAIRLSLNG